MMIRCVASWTTVADVAVRMTVHALLVYSESPMSARSRSVFEKMCAGIDIGGVLRVPVAIDWITEPFGISTVRPPPA